MNANPSLQRIHYEKARQLLHEEAEALRQVAERLDSRFDRAVEALWSCHQRDGRIGVTGVGKSADIAQKIVGTFNSTGTRAYLLDATRALHGDLGMVHRDDVVVVLSNSGESDEVVRLIHPLREMATTVIALTGNPHGRLATNAQIAVVYGPIAESSPFGLAPSTSAMVAMAVGHAMAFALCELRDFTDDEFARYHPGGSLGFKLAPVEQFMRRGPELRMALCDDTIREVFAKARHTGRRTGALMLLDREGRLAGLFTDSDLARLFERRADDCFDRPVSTVMTKSPITISPKQRMGDAIKIMQARKISELPVIDEAGRPVGMLDITDLIGVVETVPASQENASAA